MCLSTVSILPTVYVLTAVLVLLNASVLLILIVTVNGHMLSVINGCKFIQCIFTSQCVDNYTQWTDHSHNIIIMLLIIVSVLKSKRVVNS